MEFEPTIETLQWIIENADKAWVENDFRALQYWEEQKQKLYAIACKKINSIYHSLNLIVQQQQTLIEKLERGEYTPIEANRINKVLYEHREELLLELKRYKAFLEYYKSVSVSAPSDKSDSATPFDKTTPYQGAVIDVDKRKLKKIIPPLQFYELMELIFITPVKKIVLSPITQVSFFALIIIGLMLSLWFEYSKNSHLKMYVESQKSGNVYSIKLVNYGLWNVSIILDSTSEKGLSFTKYYLKAYQLDSSAKRGALLPIIMCAYTDFGPVTSSIIDLNRGAETVLLLDISCLLDKFKELQRFEIVLESNLPHRAIATEIITIGF